MRETTRRAFQEVKELPELEAAPEGPTGPVQVIVLASGSKGNGILVAYGKHALLIDAGITQDEIRRRARSVGCSLTSSAPNPPNGSYAVDAVLLTHWHGDHAKFAVQVAVDFHCHLVCSQATYVGLETQPQKYKRAVPDSMLSGLAPDSPFDVWPIKIAHEEGSLAFQVRVGGKNIVIVLDCASPNSSLLCAARAADCLLVESNHNPSRVEACQLADHLPELHRRILSDDRGHLSNAQAAEVVSHTDPERIQAICALHLSETHNNEDEAEEVIRGSIPEGAHPALYIASQTRAVLIEVNGKPKEPELPLRERFRALDKQVDAVIKEQQQANLESQERRIVIGKLCARMRNLFEEKEPDEKLEGFEFFDHWKEAKARSIQISKRMLDYWILDTETVVPLIGRETAKLLPIGTISELGKLAKAKGEISDEILQFAKDNPAHEVKAKVASVLYPGKSGHFDGAEDFLSIPDRKEHVAYLRQLLDNARNFVEPVYDDKGVAHEAGDAEVIEYALVEFIRSAEYEAKIKEQQEKSASFPSPPTIYLEG